MGYHGTAIVSEIPIRNNSECQNACQDESECQNACISSPAECQNTCQGNNDCGFWDFGDGWCRLRSTSIDPNELSESEGYVYGTKNCIFSPGKWNMSQFCFMIECYRF